MTSTKATRRNHQPGFACPRALLLARSLIQLLPHVVVAFPSIKSAINDASFWGGKARKKEKKAVFLFPSDCIKYGSVRNFYGVIAVFIWVKNVIFFFNLQPPNSPPALSLAHTRTPFFPHHQHQGQWEKLLAGTQAGTLLC